MREPGEHDTTKHETAMSVLKVDVFIILRAYYIRDNDEVKQMINYSELNKGENGSKNVFFSSFFIYFHLIDYFWNFQIHKKNLISELMHFGFYLKPCHPFAATHHSEHCETRFQCEM